MPIERDDALSALADASTEAARLAEIAHEHPDLGAQIAVHPNVYPDLVQWLRDYGTLPDATPAVEAEAVAEPTAVVEARPATEQTAPTPATASPAAAGAPGGMKPTTLAWALPVGLTVLSLVASLGVGAALAAAQMGTASRLIAGEGYTDEYTDGLDEFEQPAGTTTTISCPAGSTAVMWADWPGGATLVCQFSSTRFLMIMGTGSGVRESEEVTITPTGYSSPLGEIAFGGWAVWPAGGGAVAARTWGNSVYGSYGDGPYASDGIPGCPSGSFPLSLSTWSGGWLLTCGTLDGRATNFSYLDAGRTGSGGALEFEGGRYCGTAVDGREVCVSAAPALVQFRGDDGIEGRYSVEANYFAEAGPGGTGQGTGAYGVPVPEETAEEQVAYLEAILVKSGKARAKVNAVLAPLNACKVSSGDVRNLENLTQARTDLLAALRTTPVDQVPDGDRVLALLTRAIELSEKADIGYVKAAREMKAGKCSAGRAIYHDAIRIANNAENAKKKFVSAWNKKIVPVFDVRKFSAKDI